MCAQEFWEACEDRSEMKAVISWEKSVREEAGTGGHTTSSPLWWADAAGCGCGIKSWMISCLTMVVVGSDKGVRSALFVVVVSEVMKAKYSWKSLDLLSMWWEGMPLPLRKCWRHAVVHFLMLGCVCRFGGVWLKMLLRGDSPFCKHVICQITCK